MSKDYAKHTLFQSRQAKPRWRIEWFILAFLVIMIVSAFAVAYLHKFHIVSQVSALIFHPKNPESAKAPLSAKVDAPPSVQFDFYTELPNRQLSFTKSAEQEANKTASVTPVATAELTKANVTTKATNPPEVPASTHYVLDLGCFTDMPKASQLRISLLLSGIDADIVTLKEGAEVSYRVQKGSYRNPAEAKKAQQSLQKRGIVSTVAKG